MGKNAEKILALKKAIEKTTDSEIAKILQEQVAVLERTESDENEQDVPKRTDDKVKLDEESKDFKDFNGSRVFKSDKSKISTSIEKLLEAEEKKKNSRNFFLVKDNKKQTHMDAEVTKDKTKKPLPDMPPFIDYDSLPQTSLSSTKVINAVICDDKKGNYYYYSVSKGIFFKLPSNLDFELAPRFMAVDESQFAAKDKKEFKKKDFEGFVSMGMKIEKKDKSYILTEDNFTIDVAKLRSAMRTIGSADNNVYPASRMYYTANDKPVLLTPGLGLIIGEASSGKTAMIKSFGASVTTIGEPTADSLPFDRRTFITTIVDQINSNKVSALDSIRLLLLEGDNLVSGGVSIASASLLTALASALSRYNKQFIIAVNPSSAKASAAVGDAFLGSATSIFQLNRYNESLYNSEQPWLGVNGIVSTRNFSRNYYNFHFVRE